jgi:Zn-dependent protease/CBS domain-containing protein
MDKTLTKKPFRGILALSWGSERVENAGQRGPGGTQDPQPTIKNFKKGGTTVKGSLSLGKILGIPIRLHFTWFLIAALITWSLAVGYFPQANPGWDPLTYLIVGAVASLLFFASVLLHELGHSILALREGVPVKSITLFIFGGVAQIGQEPPTAGAEFRIAIAGPLTSLGLAALFNGLGAVLNEYAVVAAPFAYLGSINLLLAVFNMIPGFPLDGGRVLRAALWHFGGGYQKATRWAARAGQTVAFGFIGLGVLQFFFGGATNGLWLAFIGWYLNGAARSSYQQVALQDMLTGVKARNVMINQCAPVSGDLRLSRLVEDHALKSDQRCFFVTDSDSPQGVITLDDLRAIPRAKREQLTAAQVMTPASPGVAADAEDDAWGLVQKMGAEGLRTIPILEEGRLLGVITPEYLWNYVRLRGELAA